MDRVQPLQAAYTALLQRYLQAPREADIAREQALIDATELAKAGLAEGPAIDQMYELHRRAQSGLADAWRGAPAGSAQQLGREQLVRGDAQPLLLALLLPHELAQRAHHEQRWRREHETLVAMFEQTETLIVVLDPDGQCDDVNPAFCRATGWTRRQAVEGAAAWALPPPQVQTQGLRRALACRDGRELLVEWSVSPIQDRRGSLLNLVCIGRDVGRQQRIDESLRENDKLRAVATLAGGIAHDFNNLLGSINGLAELCELDAAPGSRQARNLGRIRQAGDRAAALVRQMLDFSRQSPPALQHVAVSQWLAHAEGLLRAALPHQQIFGLQVLQDSVVDIDLVQMEQVLLNIVRNAAQAIGPRSGRVSIEADRGRPLALPQAVPAAGVTDGTAASPAPAAVQPDWARLRIRDDGPGMPPEVLDKIFEPFFTTKPVGQGTGLGLAAVHGIVSSHGGVIEVSSTPGQGSCFSVFLPCVGQPA